MSIESIRERWAKATSGPWVCDDPTSVTSVGWVYSPAADAVVTDGLAADREAIAHARSDVAALLAVAEAAQAVNESDEWDGGDCPWYRRKHELPGFDPEAICDSGCETEPACETSEPTDGWPSHRLAEALADLEALS